MSATADLSHRPAHTTIGSEAAHSETSPESASGTETITSFSQLTPTPSSPPSNPGLILEYSVQQSAPSPWYSLKSEHTKVTARWMKCSHTGSPPPTIGADLNIGELKTLGEEMGKTFTKYLKREDGRMKDRAVSHGERLSRARTSVWEDFKDDQRMPLGTETRLQPTDGSIGYQPKSIPGTNRFEIPGSSRLEKGVWQAQPETPQRTYVPLSECLLYSLYIVTISFNILYIMRPTIIQPLASTSRQIITRSYAVSPSTNPHLASPSDTRTEVIRRVLYPADAHAPNSASPTGAYHPDHIKRLNHLIPDPEVYETIERAWKLDQRRKRDSRQKSLAVKLKAMQEACDELDRLTEVEGGLARSVYDRAMSRPNLKGEKVEQGKKETPESRWAAARIEGLVPREMWVPTETRGKGWKYDWSRPGK